MSQRTDETHEHYAGEFVSDIERISSLERAAGREPHENVGKIAEALKSGADDKRLNTLVNELANAKTPAGRPGSPSRKSAEQLRELAMQAANAARFARGGEAKKNYLESTRDRARGAIDVHSTFYGKEDPPNILGNKGIVTDGDAQETTYYEFQDAPAYWGTSSPMKVTPDGDVRIEELTKFVDRAVPITKDQFDAMKARLDAKDAPGPGPLFVVHPDDLQTEEQKDALAGHVAQRALELVNDLRKRDGKPPLKE